MKRKYLIFDSTDENKELLKKILTRVIMKVKFNSDDDLLLNKPLKFHMMTIIIRSVFEEDGKLYLYVFFR